MKKLLVVLMMKLPFGLLAQGKSISLVKKSIEPIVISSNDTIFVKSELVLQMGKGSDGKFLYVQMLNNFNEPIGFADSRAAMKKQEIKFFKQQDGVLYVFTKFFSINLEAALQAKEVILSKKKN